MKNSPPPVKAIKCIFFDLDGTLIDTEPSAAHAIQQVLAGWGITVEISDAEFITGRTWAAASEFLSKKYQLPISADKAIPLFIKGYQEELHRELHLVPGGAQAVRALSTYYQLGIVSGSHCQEILWALDKMGIRHLFQLILGAENYEKSKPAPDSYLKGLNYFQCAPQEALVFEDSQAGISAALAAGIRVIAITGTNHFNQDISHAHLRIPNLRGVTKKWVEEQFG